MNYSQFLEELQRSGWDVPNKSCAYKEFSPWQAAFIRRTDRPTPGMIKFVLCVRHTTLRNIEKETLRFDSAPHSYPFKLTPNELESGSFQYHRNLGIPLTEFPAAGDWSSLFRHLQKTLPDWLASLTGRDLADQIREYGGDWYIEKIWLEDLS